MEEKPTFLSTNNMKDTIKFQSGSASYFLQDEYIMVKDVNYVPVADALIQPGDGILYIDRGARIRQTDSAIVAVNNSTCIHSAKLNIESSADYHGSGKYDYISEDGSSQVIEFSEIKVDTNATKATGYIPVTDRIHPQPCFHIHRRRLNEVRRAIIWFHRCCRNCYRLWEHQECTGQIHCALIDPNNVLIPVSDKPRDINDNMLFSGTFVTLDSAGVYGTFLSERKSWSDNPILNAQGYLFHDKGSGHIPYRLTGEAFRSEDERKYGHL
jgi:hypothetical protein